MFAVAFSVRGEAVAGTVSSGDPCCSHDDTTDPKCESVLSVTRRSARGAPLLHPHRLSADHERRDHLLSQFVLDLEDRLHRLLERLR